MGFSNGSVGQTEQKISSLQRNNLPLNIRAIDKKTNRQKEHYANSRFNKQSKEKETVTLLFLVSSSAGSCPCTFCISMQLQRYVSHSLCRSSCTSDALALWLFLLDLILAFIVNLPFWLTL
jgi:hypothetical protein